jgi:pSer/pThr/pTyr-binding forkhead associated (FHA) protein
MSGPQEGTVRAITDGPLSLGRDAANQVMIGDSAVSRKHCTISQISQDVYEICDHDSHNGTLVNGIRISHTPIQHGDRIASEPASLSSSSARVMTPVRSHRVLANTRPTLRLPRCFWISVRACRRTPRA